MGKVRREGGAGGDLGGETDRDRQNLEEQTMRE